MQLLTIAQIVLGATAALATLSLLGTAFDRISRRVLVGVGVLVGLGAAAAWVAFGIRPRGGFAVVAGGMTVAFATQLACLKLRELLRTTRRVDEQLVRAQARLSSQIAREVDERNAELERTLARARADSISLLAEQERRIAEERRSSALERSRLAADELGQSLVTAQQQVEGRLNAWTDDLERTQRVITEQLAQLEQRQKQLISEAEARIAADAERLEAESEQQRAGLVRLR